MRLIIKKMYARENEHLPATDKTDICLKLQIYITISQAGTLFTSLKVVSKSVLPT